MEIKMFNTGNQFVMLTSKTKSRGFTIVLVGILKPQGKTVFPDNCNNIGPPNLTQLMLGM